MNIGETETKYVVDGDSWENDEFSTIEEARRQRDNEEKTAVAPVYILQIVKTRVE